MGWLANSMRPALSITASGTMMPPNTDLLYSSWLRMVDTMAARLADSTPNSSPDSSVKDTA